LKANATNATEAQEVLIPVQCFDISFQYTGTNMNNGYEQKEESAENCQKLCKLTTGCEGFTWASSNFKCTSFFG
jgi:hypothetical protein